MTPMMRPIVAQITAYILATENTPMRLICILAIEVSFTPRGDLFTGRKDSGAGRAPLHVAPSPEGFRASARMWRDPFARGTVATVRRLPRASERGLHPRATSG